MPNSPSEQGLIKLSIGDVITAAIRIYRDHFKPYWQQAAIAYIWIGVGVIASLLLLGVATAIASILGDIIGSLVFLAAFIAAIPLWAYCGAKYSAAQAVLARVAYFEVAEQPESMPAARIQVMPRFWRFFWANLIVGALLFLTVIALFTVGGVLVGVFYLLFAASFADNVNLVTTFLAALAFWLLFLSAIFCYIYIFSRLALTDVSLAIEPRLTSTGAFKRSWALTKGYIFSLQLIFLIAFLITIPFWVISNVGGLISLVMGLPNEVATIFNLPWGLIIGSLLVPFWQGIKAMVYYDLRTREEGRYLSLENLPLMDSDPDSKP